MGGEIRDAIRHLEKDMADILEVMSDNSVTEVILNPYLNFDGSYIGHILIDKHGKGLHNLITKQKLELKQSVIALGDNILYKYEQTKYGEFILFWLKLESPLQLSQLGFVIRSYFSEVDNEDDAVLQSEEFPILEYAMRIESGYYGQIDVLNYEQIVSLLNKNLPITAGFSFNCLTVNSEDQLQMFRSYPKYIITSDVVKMTSTKAETIMSVLASITGKFVHNKQPFLECQIPKYGHRFTGVIKPASYFPAFCIRKHSNKIYTLDDFVEQGILQSSSCETIRSWVKRKFNILIAGGTGSGKTTLANAILNEIVQQFPDTRMLIIEDVPELQFNTSRSISFTINEFFSMYDALRTTLRFKPNRIIMGEIRGAEAYTLLKAWNTGHPGGLATIHANGVNEALYRFESCVRDSPDARINRQEIGFTINGIIAIQNITVKEIVNGEYSNVVRRKVTALRQIIQYDTEKDFYQDIIFDKLEEIFD